MKTRASGTSSTFSSESCLRAGRDGGCQLHFQSELLLELILSLQPKVIGGLSASLGLHFLLPHF